MSSPASSDRINIVLPPALPAPRFKVEWVDWDVKAFVKMPSHFHGIVLRYRDILNDPRLTIVVDAKGQRPKSWVVACELAGLGQSS
jgi:hypothetical protein